jgi:hypothetical protein
MQSLFSGKRIILCFAVFGLLLGLFNFADAAWGITGGYDTPRSVLLNIPALMIDSLKSRSINCIQNLRFRELKKKVGLPGDSSLTMSKDDFNALTPEEQRAFLSKVEEYKLLARSDWIIGQNGIIAALNSISILMFLMESILAWTVIGSLVFFLLWIHKKFSLFHA